MQEDQELKLIKPFGPSIAAATMPKVIIEKINNFVDEVIKSEEKAKKLDWGKYLAGQVSQEIFLPKEIITGELGNFLGNATKIFVEAVTRKKMTKFDLIKVWIVRQFQGEYNPTHWHNGHISGAGYLKLPENFGTSKQKEKTLNLNGRINFTHGSRQFLSDSIISETPTVGKIFIFPNYLMHSVNPFYGAGERRSISFNAFIDENIYDVYSSKKN